MSFANSPVLCSGSFHQANPQRFSSDSIGRQCVAMSMTALVMTKLHRPSEWTTQDMDRLLDIGDTLYMQIVRLNPSIKCHGGLLSSSDIPSHVVQLGHTFNVRVTHETHGPISRKDITQIMRAVQTDAIIVYGDQYGAYATACFKDNHKFHIFDSHSRSPANGLPCDNGTSVLLQFASIEQLVTYFLTSAKTLNVSQVSIWHMDITSKSQRITPAPPPMYGMQQSAKTSASLASDTRTRNVPKHNSTSASLPRDQASVHTRTLYPCTFCQAPYLDQSSVLYHQQICPKRVDISACADNQRSDRSQQIPERSPSSTIMHVPSDPPSQGTNRHANQRTPISRGISNLSHKCSFCGSLYKCQATLQRHIVRCKHKNRAIRKTQQQIEKRQVSSSTSPHDSTVHCTTCNCRINSVAFNEHAQICQSLLATMFADQMRNPCKYCQQVFQGNVDLKKHMQKHHMTEFCKQQSDQITIEINSLKKKESELESIISDLNTQLEEHEKRMGHARRRPDITDDHITRLTDEARRISQLNTAKQSQLKQRQHHIREKMRQKINELQMLTKLQKTSYHNDYMKTHRNHPQKRSVEQVKNTTSKRQSRAQLSPTKHSQTKEKQRDKMKHRRSEECYRIAEGCKKKEARHKRKYGEQLAESVATFTKSVARGPVYTCSSCLQLNFPDYVHDVNTLRPGSHAETLTQCLTGTRSADGKEWLCHTCKHDIYVDKIPKLSKANLVGFPDRPEELMLNQLEEMLIAPLLPFMTIRSLPVCGNVHHGQKQVSGSVVHVPNDIATTIQSLPRHLDEMGTVSVKLKRKKTYKSSVFQENIRPVKVVRALDYLLQNSPMYRQYNIPAQANMWLNHVAETEHENRAFVEGHHIEEHQMSDSEQQDDQFEEVNPSEQTQGDMSTMLDEGVPIHVDHEHTHESDTSNSQQAISANATLCLAPGEGKIPVFKEPRAEYLCFPTLFCGMTRPSNQQRKRHVTTAELFKAEAKHSDPRVSMNIPNLFWKAKHLQVQQIANKVTLALRRVVGPHIQNLDAKTLLDKASRERITRLDEGYYIFRTIRSSPAYFLAKKKELMAMVRQLGIPTIFFSLSAADTAWVPLLQTLGLLVDHQQYTEEYITRDMTFDKKCQLVSAHPTICSRYFSYRVKKFFTHVLSSPYSNFGHLQDYFYRVEFQKRGSPHIHGLCWMKNAPVFDKNTDQEVCDYVDNCISCSLDVPEDQQPFVKLQTHKHSKTCKRIKKNLPTCRFGAPWPPMRRTCILRPIDIEEDLDIKHLSTLYASLATYYKTLNDTVQTHEDWLTFIGMVESDYINCIRTSIIRPKIYLKRAPTETRVNPYMKDLLSAWKANHDVQYVLDPYQCVTYICDYMTKSHKEMSRILQEACDQAKAQNMTLKESIRHMGNKFINASETSAQEAGFDVMQLLITNSTRKKEHISTCEPQHRVALTKSVQELEQLKPTSKDVAHKSNIERYAMRPKQLEHWCLADYVAKLDLEYPHREDKPTNQTMAPDVNNIDEEHLEAHDAESGYIAEGMFPIELKNGLKLKCRLQPKIIRFVNYRQRTNPEDYARERLLLYTPWRKESEILSKYSSYHEALQDKMSVILAKLLEYEPLSSVLEDVEREMENHDNTLTDHTVAPSTQHADECDDDHAAPLQDCLADQHTLPSFDIGPAIGLPTNQDDPLDVEFNQAILNDTEYASLIASLNRKQQEFHSHIIHNATGNKEQVLCALHGGAGTGKSTVVHAIAQSLFRVLNKQPGEDSSTKRVLLVAPTGKAAYNIKGTTIHRAFCIPASQRIEYRELTKDKLNTIRSSFLTIQWIIIDEFSMVGNKMLEFIYLRLQEITGTKLPFGGVNVVCVGDLFQLQPVMQKYIFMDNNTNYGPLATNLWKEYFTMFELTEIMRQKDDEEFAMLLNRLRQGHHTQNDIDILQSRTISQEDSYRLTHLPHFYPTRDEAASYNSHVLEHSTGFSMTVHAMDATSNDVSSNTQKAIIAAAQNKEVNSAGNLPYALILKVGQLYDITSNISPEDGIVNGAECTLQYIEQNPTNATFPARVWVKFTDPDIGRAQRRLYMHTHPQYIHLGWTPIHSTQRAFTVKREHVVIRTQFSLRLASARTIHVAQSSTYKEIVIDMSTSKRPPDHWWEHMHYVAFSRCTSLLGLHIVNVNTEKIRVSRHVKTYLQDEQKPMTLCYTPTYHTNDTLSIAFNNVGGLPAKWNMVASNHNVTCAAIIILAETWLSTSHSTQTYHLPHHRQFRQDCTLLAGRRGLLLFVHQNVMLTAIQFHQTTYLETLQCSLKHNGKPVHLIGLYKPPTTRITQFRTDLHHILKDVNPGEYVVLVGDFNINIANSKNADFPVYMHNTYALTQCVSEPTTWSGTCIDLVFTNIQSINSSPLTTVWSGHHLIMTSIPNID